MENLSPDGSSTCKQVTDIKEMDDDGPDLASDTANSDEPEKIVDHVVSNVCFKRSSPLKHVTPIFMKYIKGKGSKSPVATKGNNLDQQGEKQTLRPIAPKPPIMVVISSSDKTVSTITQVQTMENPSMPDLSCDTDYGHESTEQTPTEVSEASQDALKEQAREVQKDYGSPTEEIKDLQEVEKKDNEDEMAALMLAATTTSIKSSPKSRSAIAARKRSRQLRDIEATLILLAPDSDDVKDEKAFGFAQAYFMKVTERLEGKDDAAYQEFLKTMNEFGTTILTVPDLYWKVTTVLKLYPDLAEEFLAFLLPEQAMQCGKFMEHLMLTKMRDFFRKLEICFVKQPQQMRKIYSSLSTLSSQTNVTIKDVRTTILPLLKGNSFLIDSFLQLLPQERPPNSCMTDIEDLEFGDADSDHSVEGDWFETLHVPDQKDLYGGEGCLCVCHTTGDDKFRSRAAHCVPCGTRFIHGNIFVQTGKALRPAKVVFDGDKSETIKRLSVKRRPRNRIRRRTGNHTVVAGNRKSNSPNKSAQISSHENTEDSDNLLTRSSKTSPPKASRAAKSRGSNLSLKKTTSKTSTTSSSKATQSEVNSNKNEPKISVKESKSNASRSSRLINNAAVVPKSRTESPQISIMNVFNTETLGNYGDNIPTSYSVPSLSEIYKQNIHNKSVVQEHPTKDVHNPYLSILQRHDLSIPSTSSATGSSIAFSHKQPSESAAVKLTLKDFSCLSRVLRSRNVNISEVDSCDLAIDRMDTSEPHQNCETSVSSKLKPQDCSNQDTSDSTSRMEVSENVDSSPEGVIWPIAVCDTMMDSMDVECESTDNSMETSEGNRLSNIDEHGDSSNSSNLDQRCDEWTREEDKTILQMFQLEFDTEQILLKIGQLLPLRTINQIRARFQILMNLLQQITGAKMEEEGEKPNLLGD